MDQSLPLFVYFLDTISIIQSEKSIDGVLGIRTLGRRMVGADKTMELWRMTESSYLKPTFKFWNRYVPLQFR